jgi:hypothetical protein
MPRVRVLIAIVLSIGATGLAGCAPADDAAVAAISVRYAVLNADDQPLRDDFNRNKSAVRLMFLVDPRCPGCLRGLADMGDDLLSKLPQNASVEVYVVYEPVIGGTVKDIPAAAALLKTQIAHHYWNPTGALGNQMSHVLGYWNGRRWVYAWDTWLIYPPDAVWSGQDPPRPSFLMHQLGGLDSRKFPRLDGQLFAAQVNSMLTAMDQKAAAR